MGWGSAAAVPPKEPPTGHGGTALCLSHPTARTHRMSIIVVCPVPEELQGQRQVRRANRAVPQLQAHAQVPRPSRKRSRSTPPRLLPAAAAAQTGKLITEPCLRSGARLDPRIADADHRRRYWSFWPSTWLGGRLGRVRAFAGDDGRVCWLVSAAVGSRRLLGPARRRAGTVPRP